MRRPAKEWGGYIWFTSVGTVLPLPVFLIGYLELSGRRRGLCLRRRFLRRRGGGVLFVVTGE